MTGRRGAEAEPLWDVDQAEDYDPLVGTNGGTGWVKGGSARDRLD